MSIPPFYNETENEYASIDATHAVCITNFSQEACLVLAYMHPHLDIDTLSCKDGNPPSKSPTLYTHDVP